MTKNTPDQPQPIPSEAYTREYYEHCCEGHLEFKLTRGQSLLPRLAIPLELADITPGQTIVDIGSGRGEIILHCAQKGAKAWGLDYSEQAVIIADAALSEMAEDYYKKAIAIQQADATRLPFPNDSIDLVFMLDVVEHLYPDQLAQAFTEIHRILKPGGRLIVHTMPSLWYYHYGYPVYRWLQRLRGQQLPEDPRDRWQYKEVHVNEQTPAALRNALRDASFQTRVWLQTTVDYDYEKNSLVRHGMEFLTRVYPFRWIFCNDIFGIGVK
jgi:ubiquinone/menaquinone biosynthesis C-methylase UbiE